MAEMLPTPSSWQMAEMHARIFKNQLYSGKLEQEQKEKKEKLYTYASWEGGFWIEWKNGDQLDTLAKLTRLEIMNVFCFVMTTLRFSPCY